MKAAVPTLLVLFILLSGCTEEQVKSVPLPETPVLSARESWGVPAQSYVRVYVEAQGGAAIVGHLRAGVVAEITGRIVRPTGRDGWVQVRQADLVGWVRRQEIELYDTRERAENAAQVILGG